MVVGVPILKHFRVATVRVALSEYETFLIIPSFTRQSVSVVTPS